MGEGTKIRIGVATAVGGVLAFTLLGLGIWCWRRKRTNKSGNLNGEGEDGTQIMPELDGRSRLELGGRDRVELS